MKRIIKWRSVIASGGVALGAYVLFLLVLAPASLLDAGLQHATDGRLRLAQAQGTLWSGTGVLEIRSATGRDGVGKNLAWVLQPRSLPRGRLEFAVNLDHRAPPFPLHLSAGGIELSNMDFTLPASTLGIAVPRIAPIGLRGDLAVHVTKFSSLDDSLSAHAVVTWKDASSALTSVAPLGTYQLLIDGNDGLLAAVLQTNSGPLQLQGTGSWRGSGPLMLSATARVDAQHRAQLAPLLRLIAIERGNGDFDLQFGPPLRGVSTGKRAKNR